MYAFFVGAGVTLLYIAIAGAIVLPVRKFLTIPDELFRKILHFILLGAYIPLVFAFEEWWQATLFALALMVVLFPALFFAGKIPTFSSFVNERKKGEFKSSMVLAVSVMAASLTVGWGVFGDKYLVLASIYAWGIGDGLAALVGKKFGKHKIKWRFADNRKSVEGSMTMLLCAFLSVLIVLLVRGGISLPLCFVVAVLTAAACTVTELCAKGGWDTVLCPSAAMVVIIPLVMLFGG